MTAIKMGAVVGDGGRVELTVPLPAGTAVEVFVRDPSAENEDEIEVVEWNDDLQQRLDALEREEIDSRPWREALAEMRAQLANRATTP